MLGYVTALYPLILILLLVPILNLYSRGVKPIVIIVRPFHYALGRFRQVTHLRQSFTAGIAVFILMSYNKLATVSFNLIPFYHLFDADGKRKEAVFYHQGTKKFPQEGILYIATATFILSTFCLIPPIVLAYSSVLKFLDGFKCLRSRLSIHKYYPNHKLQAFLDEFHGCYKNGNGTGRIDCRWFASFYFLLRIILFFVFSQVNTWQQLYIAQAITFLFCMALFAIVRPYHDDWINNVDTCAFAILTAVSTISLYNLQLAMIQNSISFVAFSVQFILMMIPMMYCLLYYLVLFYQWLKQKHQECLSHTNRIKCDRYCHDDASFDGSSYITKFFNFIQVSGRYRQREPLIFSSNGCEDDDALKNKYGTIKNN